MRGSRPKHDRNEQQQPLGNQLRDALAKKRAGDDVAEQQREADAEATLRQALSSWFNGVAADIPAKIDAITKSLSTRSPMATDFSYSASEQGVSLRDAGAVELETLPGFQKLDQTCKDLNIECTVSEGRTGYGRKSGAGQQYLHVNVDAEKPYRALTVAKPRHGGSRYH